MQLRSRAPLAQRSRFRLPASVSRHGRQTLGRDEAQESRAREAALPFRHREQACCSPRLRRSCIVRRERPLARSGALGSASLRQRRCPCSLRSGARTRRRHAYAPDATSPARWRFGCSSVATVRLDLLRRSLCIEGITRYGVQRRTAASRFVAHVLPADRVPHRVGTTVGCLGDEAVLVQSKEPPAGSRARSSRSPGPSPARKWGRTASSARWS